MSVQDDKRENEQIKLFQLSRLKDESRIGTDAILTINKKIIFFELKTTTNGSVTTVRDFGPNHIKKWKKKHWLISKYDSSGKNLEYSLYGSPSMMKSWIKEKEEYIKLDFTLKDKIPDYITSNDLFSLIGKKDKYSYEDAKKIQKRQYVKAEYEKLMDLKNGYSQNKMLEILKDRAKYLIHRGSTLNNPHINKTYFKGWTRITSNHAETLRKMVIQELSKT